jgi:mannosyltransferase
MLSPTRNAASASGAQSGVFLLGGTLVIGALLRFATLGAKSYWGDEISTLFLVRRGFGPMFDGIARLESTPPLYYALAKIWHAVAGNEEAAVRALPATFGCAAIVVAYVAARELVSSRAAVIAAVLLAVNPMLVWYSGEARSYSLAVLLGATSLLYFARAVHCRPRAILWWAVGSSLAMATHYFSVFVVAPEAYLLYRRFGRSNRPLWWALVAVGAAGAGLVPLAVHQSSFDHTAWITHSLLPLRVLRAPADLLVGFDAPGLYAIGPIAVALAGAGMWWAVKRVSARHEREGITLATTIGVTALALPVGAGVVGADYFASRNVIEALVPLTIVVASGFSALPRRTFVAVPCALVGLSLFVVVSTANEPKYHSEDWRAAARALGADSAAPRLVVVTPGQAGRKPLMIYLGEGTHPLIQARTWVSELDLVVEPHQGSSSPDPTEVRPLAALRPRGFHLVARLHGAHYDIFKLRTPAPRLLSPRVLDAALGHLRATFLLEQ